MPEPAFRKRAVPALCKKEGADTIMIEINKLSFAYSGKQIFDGLSLSLGEYACITGPSGCGKTTLLRLIAGLEKPQGGTITGVPDRVSFMFQEDRLLPWGTARENVASVLPTDETDKVDYWLEQVELKEHGMSYPANMSGGQKRRVALARALAYGGGLLLLDEPFKGFDAKLAKRMADLIRSTNMPVIASVHSSQEMGFLGGEIIKLG